MIVSVTEPPGATFREAALGAMVMLGGTWLTEKISVALLLRSSETAGIYFGNGIRTHRQCIGNRRGKHGAPELLSVTVGCTVPSTAEDYRSAGTNVYRFPG